MKVLSGLCLLALIACSHSRSPASLSAQKMARGNAAYGKIEAVATKMADKTSVCFDIDLKLKGGDQVNALPSNWTLAWIDAKNTYHLLDLNQRDPASVPGGGRVAAQYGEYDQWKNNFKTCAPGAEAADVKTLVLTPKNIPFNGNSTVFLTWDK